MCIAISMESEIKKKVKRKIGIKLMENEKISSFLEEKIIYLEIYFFFFFQFSNWLQPFNIKSDFQMMIIFVDYESSSEGNRRPLKQKLLFQKETPKIELCFQIKKIVLNFSTYTIMWSLWDQVNMNQVITLQNIHFGRLNVPMSKTSWQVLKN